MADLVSSASSAVGAGASQAETLIGGDSTTPHAAPPPEVIRGTEIGRYLIVGEIGRGASGRVYSAYDGDLDRRLALKLVSTPIGGDHERRRALMREAQAMAKIRHPNVVAVHDVGTFEGRVYVAMEFVEGVTLGRWCAGPGRTIDDILGAYVQAGRGLAAAHAAGVVHRDFKPDNALVGADGTVHVADFGLAQPSGGTPRGGDVTSSGAETVGTPAYMSPEQYCGVEVDARSDQFSFCVALFEALCGARPFQGGSLAELAASTLDGRIREPVGRAMPRRVAEVVRRGLAVVPGDRHPSMDALLAALVSAHRRRWPWALGVIAAAAFVGTGWAVLRPDPGAADGCESGAARAATVWDADRREALSLADPALTANFVRDREARLRTTLDEYAQQWATMYDELCPALLVAPASDAVASARRSCVEDRLASLGGLVEFFAERVVSPHRVGTLVETLPQLSECRDDNVVMVHPVPTDPVAAEQVGAIRARLREFSRTVAWDAKVGATSEVESIVAQARSIDEPHLLVSALLVQARLRYFTGEADGGSRVLEEAWLTAIASGQDALAVEAIAGMMERRQNSWADGAEVERWFNLALALTRRIGNRPKLRARLLLSRGSSLLAAADLARALDAFEQAERAFEMVEGPTQASVAKALVNQGLVLKRLGDNERARERLARALESSEVAEPAVVIAALQAAAFVEQSLGDRSAAEPMLRRGVALAREIYGERGRELSTVLFNLAMFEADGGDSDAATETLADSRRAWPVVGDGKAEAEFGVAEAWLALHRGDTAAVLSLADRFIPDVASRPGGKQDQEFASLHVLKTVALQKTGECRAALDTAATFYDLPGIHVTSAVLLRIVARSAIPCALALGDLSSARLWLARLDIHPPEGTVEVIAWRFGHALFRGRRDAEAVAEVARDRDLAAREYGEHHVIVAELDAWLGKPIERD